MTDHPNPTRVAAAESPCIQASQPQHPVPSRPGSPFRLNLEQQYKRATDLQRALRAAEPDALARFRRHHPNAPMLLDSKEMGRLSEAQLVVARELGLPSWSRLKAHVLAMQHARDSITNDAQAADEDSVTLHIRCGSDLKNPLRAAGFAGDFLEYADPLCQGPVVDDANWLDRRAAFLAQAYGRWTASTAAKDLDNLQHAEHALQAAAGSYQRVVIWVEHDSYDQLVLARCLAQFAEAMPPRLELISINRYPGPARFIGLGQLPLEALRLLWRTRQPVSAQQLATGRAVWDMLRLGDPSRLAAAARSGLAELPQMAGALRRHCQELPGLQDGLSLTQRLVLQVLSEGSRTVNQIWNALLHDIEPLPWLGDLMLLSILESMKAIDQPVFTCAFAGDQRHWRDEQLSITALGRAVLAAAVDWMSLSPPERWLGGVRITPDEPCWRWNEASSTTFLQ